MTRKRSTQSQLQCSTTAVLYLQEERVLQDSLHRDHQQVPQRELAVVCSLWTLLQEKGQGWPICYRRTWRPSWEKVQNERRVIDAVGSCDPAETSMMKQQLYLQLHADILFVFAHAVQQSDGCFHMAAVFPIDQQPRAEYKDDTMPWTSCGRRL